MEHEEAAAERRDSGFGAVGLSLERDQVADEGVEWIGPSPVEAVRPKRPRPFHSAWHEGDGSRVSAQSRGRSPVAGWPRTRESTPPTRAVIVVERIETNEQPLEPQGIIRPVRTLDDRFQIVVLPPRRLSRRQADHPEKTDPVDPEGLLPPFQPRGKSFRVRLLGSPGLSRFFLGNRHQPSPQGLKPVIKRVLPSFQLSDLSQGKSISALPLRSKPEPVRSARRHGRAWGGPSGESGDGMRSKAQGANGSAGKTGS